VKNKISSIAKTKNAQTPLFKNESNSSYGGSLLTTRKGRLHGRPLDTKNSMHLVLRSSKVKGEWSFKRRDHEHKISRWKKLKLKASDRFFDLRSFTRIVKSFREVMNLRDYIRINRIEGFGYNKETARQIVKFFACAELIEAFSSYGVHCSHTNHSNPANYTKHILIE
jgi:hypothetical protein